MELIFFQGWIYGNGLIAKLPTTVELPIAVVGRAEKDTRTKKTKRGMTGDAV